MNIALVSFLFLWVVVFITGLVVWVPNYVDEKYRGVTIQFIIAGFTFIALTTKFVDHLLNDEMNFTYIALYVLAIIILVVAATGVYYWIPTYFPEGIEDPITGTKNHQFLRSIVVSCFILSLLFINIYEREYSESICRCASKMLKFGGKKLKK